MALKERLEAAGFDTSGLDEAALLGKLDQAGFDTSSLTQKQPMGQTVMGAAKDAAMTIPVVGAVNQFMNAPEAVQQGIMTGGGAMAGEAVAGPVGAGAGAAIGGGMAETMQNPQTALKYIKPLMNQALSPTPANVMSTVKTAKDGKEEIGEFAKRRGIEAATAAATSGVLKAGAKWAVGKPEGPFSAAFDSPSVVSKTVRGNILKELGAAKQAAKVGDDVAEASRLRRMLSIGQAGKVKLAEEAIENLQKGRPMSTTQLLAYKEALGKVGTKGGTFADDYIKGAKEIGRMLHEQAPNVAKHQALAHKVFLSMGEQGGKDSLIGAVKALGSPIQTLIEGAAGPMRLAGAASRGIVEGTLPTSQILATVMNRRRKK